MEQWETILELDSNRKVVFGGEKALAEKVRKGCDLRVATVFRHNEHVDPASSNDELIEETGDFSQSVLLNGCWSAAFMTLRQPVSIPAGFGKIPSLSLFLYNQNGQQAMARLSFAGKIEEPAVSEPENMPKMHVQGIFDNASTGLSKNFIYDFDEYRFLVNDSWTEIYSNSCFGECNGGNIDELGLLCRQGYKIKVSVSGLFTYQWGGGDIGDEIFIHGGSSYYYTKQKLMILNTHPFVSVPPGMPLLYSSEKWSYGWLIVRSDGYSVIRSYNPFTCKFADYETRFSIRWFANLC
jgi:hypothetical protein